MGGVEVVHGLEEEFYNCVLRAPVLREVFGERRPDHGAVSLLRAGEIRSLDVDELGTPKTVITVARVEVEAVGVGC